MMITKNLYKKILGLFIVVISFCLFLPAVYAEKCDNIDPDVFGLKLDYNASQGTFTLKMQGTTNAKFKIVELNFVNCAAEDVEDVDYCVANAPSTDIWARIVGDDNISQVIQGGKIEISNGQLITFVNVRQYNVARVKLESVSGSNISGCDKFYINLLYQYNSPSYEPIDFPPIVIGDGDSFAYSLSCDNYQNRYTPASFEYNFCRDKYIALNTSNDDGHLQANIQFTKEKNTFDKYFGNNHTIQLKCDWKTTVDSSNMDDKDYYTNYGNTKYMYGQLEEEISVGSYTYHKYYTDNNGIVHEEPIKEEAKCTIRYEEVLVAEYGPPIASKAGLCFQYKVKVTSRVNAESTGEVTPPKVNHNLCTPAPICKNSTGTYNQGGPNDDFDDCISSCDGGKYTERCSVKCYNQIYGALSSTKQFASPVVQQACVRKYVVENGRIVWKTCTGLEHDSSNNSAYSRPGRQKGKAYELAVLDSDPTWHKTTTKLWGMINSGKNPNPDSEGYYGRSRYELYTMNGIPKRYSCNDTCWWNARVDTCVGYYYLNEIDARADYEANMKIYEALKDKCSAALACNTTEATFQISVDYVNTANKKMTIYYPYNNNSHDSVDRIQFGGNNTLNNSCDFNNPDDCNNKVCTTLINQNKPITANNGNYNGCYQNPNDLNSADNTSNPRIEQRWYQAEWTFAGSWFSKANGLTYHPVCNPLYVVEKKFCLPLNVKNVNQKWYNYYQNKVNQGGGYSYDDSSYLNNIEKCNNNGSSTIWNNPHYDGSDITYNIHASTRKFGYFEWNIDMECFYAINSNFPASSDDDSSEEVKCLNGKEEYRIRTVDLKNLFPSESGAQPDQANDPTITGRSPGFNWSKYADTTEKDPEFASQPSKYTKWVQKTAMNGQSYDDAYLDYEFNITKSQIAAIKKSNHKYTDFAENDDVNYDRTGSVVRYKSSLFRNGGILANGDNKLPNDDALKCNNMVNWQSSSCQDLEA